jgi:hypothetical protein
MLSPVANRQSSGRHATPPVDGRAQVFVDRHI